MKVLMSISLISVIAAVMDWKLFYPTLSNTADMYLSFKAWTIKLEHFEELETPKPKWHWFWTDL